MLIENNCSCELSLFLESVSDPHECRRYNKYRCLECGKIFEMFGGEKKHITSDKKFVTLHKEYIGYLLNYNELDASDIMFYKYNNNLFKSLIDEGIEKNKALNLIRNKNIERDDI